MTKNQLIEYLNQIPDNEEVLIEFECRPLCDCVSEGYRCYCSNKTIQNKIYSIELRKDNTINKANGGNKVIISLDYIDLE